MPVQLGQSLALQFATQSVGGVSKNADSLPTGVLVRNGNDTAEMVTIENVSTGVYKASWTIPASWSLQDIVQTRIAATVDTVTGRALVWSDIVENPARGGAGSVEVVLTIKDSDGDTIQDCEVWVTTDAAGTNLAGGTLETDADGQVTFWLDPGTYYRWAQKTGENFDNPQSFVVT